jgi:translocation and assembly module TamA
MPSGGRTGLLVLLGLHGLSCASSEEKPDGPLIDSFRIEGTQQVKESELKKKVVTSDTFAPWLPFFGREERFDQNAWTADQRRIERYYQAHGFYQARVVEEDVKDTRQGHVELRLKVDEGDPTRIERFEVVGLEPLTDAERKRVLEKLPPQKGRVFLEEEWTRTQKQLSDRLQKLGYAGVTPETLEARALVDVGKQTADLEVRVVLGKRYKFGRVYVSNPDGQVSSRLITDQVTSVIAEGEWFNPDLLEEAQARVLKMGVFSAVKVTRAALDQQDGVAPVAVDVREAPFTTWRGGPGFAIDQLRTEVRGTLLYENRNFLGGTRRLTLRARGGLAFLAGTSTSGVLAIVSVVRGEPGSQWGPFGQVTAEIEQPHFLHRALSIQFALEPSYTIEPAYRAGGGNTRLSLVWRPTSHVTASTSVNFSIYQLSAPVALGTSTPAFVGCGLTCVLQYEEESIAWDRRDDPLSPHEGWYLALDLQQGGDTLATGGFAYNFYRFTPEGRYFVSFFDKKFTIAARARLGVMLTTRGSAPIPVRYFSGGNDMRGFSAQRLAPYDVVPLTNCTDVALDAATRQTGVCPGNGQVVPVGGNTLLDGSLEFRWNVWEWVTIATFVDTGYVTQGGLSADLFAALNWALGVGARFQTPIGPIRVDLAARLPFGAPLERAGLPRQNAVASGCFFGLGAGPSATYPGSPEGLCAFHISVGEAF